MTNKERLENISPKGFDLNGNVLLSSDDYYWLKERAEYVEELEKDLDEWRNESLRLFERFEEYQERYLETKELLKSIVDQNKRLREALRFYADEETYEIKFATDTDEIFDPFTLIELDMCKKARKALEVKESE